MKIAVTGSEGKLGSWLVNKFGFTPLECNILKPEEVQEAINTVSPDVIIHTAALTNVEYCQEHPKEAYEVNVHGTSNIVDVFTKGLLIYCSTVHVFSGNQYFAYSENHKPSPVNVYGFTKWAGEALASFGSQQTIVVRTSKLFDLAYLVHGIKLLQDGITQDYPTFITRSFVYTPHFIQGLLKLIDLRETAPNIVNIAGNGAWSYYDFWGNVAIELGYDSSYVMPRTVDNGELSRPKRGGLSTDLAARMGLPIYSAFGGIKAVKEIM